MCWTAAQVENNPSYDQGSHGNDLDGSRYDLISCTELVINFLNPTLRHVSVNDRTRTIAEMINSPNQNSVSP
jgi:hypothetical protein